MGGHVTFIAKPVYALEKTLFFLFVPFFYHGSSYLLHISNSKKNRGKMSYANASLSSWWLNQPIWKILVKLGIISPNRDEHKKDLKPPPSYFLATTSHHHLHHQTSGRSCRTCEAGKSNRLPPLISATFTTTFSWRFVFLGLRIFFGAWSPSVFYSWWEALKNNLTTFWWLDKKPVGLWRMALRNQHLLWIIMLGRVDSWFLAPHEYTKEKPVVLIRRPPQQKLQDLYNVGFVRGWRCLEEKGSFKETCSILSCHVRISCQWWQLFHSQFLHQFFPVNDITLVLTTWSFQATHPSGKNMFFCKVHPEVSGIHKQDIFEKTKRSQQ